MFQVEAGGWTKTPKKEPWEAGVWGARAGEVQDDGRGGRAAQPGSEGGLLRAAGSLLEARDQIFCKHPQIIMVHDSNLYLTADWPYSKHLASQPSCKLGANSFSSYFIEK